VQRGELTEPVVRAGRARSARLVEVDDEMRAPHRDIDRFAQRRGELLTDRPGLLGEVQTTEDRIGQTQHAKAQALFAAVLSLLNQFAVLRGRE
jgi:hypothetical protein